MYTTSSVSEQSNRGKLDVTSTATAAYRNTPFIDFRRSHEISISITIPEATHLRTNEIPTWTCNVQRQITRRTQHQTNE